MTGGWGPGSTSLTRFGCLSAWPRSGVGVLSLRVGGAWFPAFAGMTGGCGGGAGMTGVARFSRERRGVGGRGPRPLQGLGVRVHEGWGCVDSGFRRNDGGEGGRDLFRCSLNLLFMRVGGAWFPAFAGMTGGCRNDGGLGAGVHVPYTLRLSQCLAAVWGRRAVPEGWGCVVSGFRRNDGGVPE